MNRITRVLIVVLGAFWLQASEAQELEFHFINVGQGDCSLVKCPNGLTVLVDCGNLDGDPAISRRARQYIVNQLSGAPAIDVVVITHPDSDHYRFLPDVLEGIQVGRLLHVGRLSDHRSNDTDDWMRLQNRIALDVDDIDQPDSPSDLFDSGAVDFHILAANIPAQASVKNAKSIVLRVDLGDFEAILTGDATFDTEAAIANNYTSEFLNVELLKVGHHGSSATSTSDEWVRLLRPQAAVVSAGFDSDFQHPRKRVIDRLATTAEDGAPEHFMRWGVRENGGSARLRTTSSYTETIFNSASNGNVVVTTNGAEYGIEWGGDGLHSGEVELAAAPGEALPVDPVFRSFEIASITEGGTEIPFLEADERGFATPLDRRTDPRSDLPPIQVGASVVVETTARTVKGVYLGTENGWVIVKEEGSGKTYVRSDTIIIRVVEGE